MGNFHLPSSGKAFFSAIVDNDEPKMCDIKQNGEQCIGSQ